MIRALFLAALSFAIALTSACSESAPASSDRAPARTDAASATARARPDDRARPDRNARGATEPQPIDPATLGSIRVSCSLKGEPPKRGAIDVSREPACNVHASPPMTEKVVSSAGKLANVLVRIKSGHEGWVTPAPSAEPVFLDQKGCIYTPHVVALQLGQELLVRNSDALTHNVNFRAKRNQSKNQSQAQGSPPLRFELERTEDSIPVKCDIHPWMGAWVHIEEHPWFGISGADGALVIEGVPPGKYSLEAIHEEYGKLRQEIEVEPSGSAEVEFTYDA